MSLKLYEENDVRGIADAIRSKNGLTDTYTISQMPSAIMAISGGGGGQPATDTYVDYTNKNIVTLNNSNIWSVPASAFANSPNLMTVSLPNCTSIGANAFANCSNLKEVSLTSKHISLIDRYAFSSCFNLSKVNLNPSGIVAILNSNTFNTLKESNFSINAYTMWGGFENNSYLRTINLPYLASISSGFASCSNLSSISMPMCSYISGNTFANCYSLSSLTFNGYQISGSSTFYKNGVSSLYLTANSVVKITSNTFTSSPFTDSSILGYYGSIYVPEPLVDSYKSSTYWSAISDRIVGFSGRITNEIPAYQYTNVTGLASIPEEDLSTSGVGPYAFSGKTALTEVNLPNCEFVNNYAFRNCYNIQNVSLPNCKILGTFAFNAARKIQNIELPNVLVIGNDCFYDCPEMTTVSIPKCVRIDNDSFGSCSRLSSINCENVCKLLGSVFERCSSLTQISLPNCRYIAGSNVFGSTAISILSLPKLVSLNTSCFIDMRSLQELYFYNLLSMSSNIAWRCTRLSKVVLGMSSYCIGSTSMFYNTPIQNSTYLGYYGSIYVPSSMVDTYKILPYWRDYADRITAMTDDMLSQ